MVNRKNTNATPPIIQGSFLCTKFIGVDSDDRIVEVPWPTLTILDRQGIWHNRQSYIGKKLTFEYFERTPAGAYRFPRAKAVRNYE